MPGRESDRTKHRTPCTISIGAQRHNGLVIDFSRSGLFLQTAAKPEIGAQLEVEMVIRGQPARLKVEVARRKQVPPQLRTVAHGGLGVRIIAAPEEFYQLLADAQGLGQAQSSARSGPAGARGAKPRRAPAGRAFKVRVKQVAGSRTRTLHVHGADETSAREEVALDLGDGWKVLEITPA